MFLSVCVGTGGGGVLCLSVIKLYVSRVVVFGHQQMHCTSRHSLAFVESKDAMRYKNQNVLKLLRFCSCVLMLILLLLVDACAAAAAC